MPFLRSLSIGAKLLILPTSFVLALLIISAVAYRGLSTQQAVIEEIDQVRFQQYKTVLETSTASQAAMVGAYAMGCASSSPTARLTPRNWSPISRICRTASTT